MLLAGDPVQAVHLARRELPDVIVLKLRLPAGGGLSVLKRIRRSVHTTFIPVIGLVGGGTDDRGSDEMLAAGAQLCLDEPGPDEICQAIEGQLAGRLAVVRAPDEAVLDPGRLRALDGIGLLDSQSDAGLEALTRLVARLLQVPIALLSLVDRHRQFFASQAGLPEPWATARETPLSHSFCQWVVAGEEPLLVSDARQHPALKDNQAVHDLGVIAYAGVPLTAPTGDRVGSFCGIDTQPHDWSERDHAVLRDFVDVIGGLVALRTGGDGGGAIPDGDPWDLADVLRSVTKGVAGATRILRREGQHLEADDRDLLLSALDRQTGELSRLVGGSWMAPGSGARGDRNTS